MNIRNLALGLGSIITMAVASCAAADKNASAPTNSASAPATSAASPADSPALSGWYLQGASGSRLQPCGQSVQWPIGKKSDLQARAKRFGLEDDTPVYVKLLAKISGSAGSTKKVDVLEVVQFGSPTPVRDCSMTGVVTPAPGS